LGQDQQVVRTDGLARPAEVRPDLGIAPVSLPVQRKDLQARHESWVPRRSRRCLTSTDRENVERGVLDPRSCQRLSAKVDSRKEQAGDDGGGHPIDDQAKWRPPPRVGDEVASVLPEILYAVSY